MDVSGILREKFFGYDMIIFLWAIAAAAFYTAAHIIRYQLKRCFSEESEARRENNFKQECIKPAAKANEAQILKKHLRQEQCYTAFLDLISAFPLLGMIGTVWALLQLTANGADDMITSSFFGALTSTFWGAVFGVIGKLLDCILSPLIEDNNERYSICIERNTLNADIDAVKAGEADEKKQDIT